MTRLFRSWWSVGLLALVAGTELLLVTMHHVEFIQCLGKRVQYPDVGYGLTCSNYMVNGAFGLILILSPIVFVVLAVILMAAFLCKRLRSFWRLAAILQTCICILVWSQIPIIANLRFAHVDSLQVGKQVYHLTFSNLQDGGFHYYILECDNPNTTCRIITDFPLNTESKVVLRSDDDASIAKLQFDSSKNMLYVSFRGTTLYEYSLQDKVFP
jgi:hypothetical protein